MIGFSFFLPSPSKNMEGKILPFLIPFFSVKTILKEEKILLKKIKNTSFGKFFYKEDKGNFINYEFNEEYFFSTCTDDKIFYQLMLVKLNDFCSKINHKFSPPTKTKKDAPTQEKKILSLKSKC
jgi:hypothetical protein